MGTGLGPRKLRDHRAGAHRPTLKLEAPRPPRHHRRGCRHHALQDEKASRGAAPGAVAPEPCARHDIFEEVTRQMNSLKRQASKAERYAALREEMRARLRVVLASRLAALDARIRAKTDFNSQNLQCSWMSASPWSFAGRGAAADTERGYALDAEGRAAAQTASKRGANSGASSPPPLQCTSASRNWPHATSPAMRRWPPSVNSLPRLRWSASSRLRSWKMHVRNSGDARTGADSAAFCRQCPRRRECGRARRSKPRAAPDCTC